MLGEAGLDDGGAVSPKVAGECASLIPQVALGREGHDARTRVRICDLPATLDGTRPADRASNAWAV